MYNRIIPLAVLAFVASCSGSPSTPKPAASGSPKASASATPAGTATTGASTAPTATATPTAAPAKPATSADAVTLSIDGAAVTVAPTFGVGTSGKGTQWAFDKPDGFAPADKWYFDINLGGKASAPKSGATVDDIDGIILNLREGTGATSQERVYSLVGAPVSGLTIANGKFDFAYKGSVDKLGYGAGGPGGPDTITVDLVVKGVPLP